MQQITNKDEKIRKIFETAQKMKDGTIKPTRIYNIDEFTKNIKS